MFNRYVNMDSTADLTYCEFVVLPVCDAIEGADFDMMRFIFGNGM